MKQQPGPIWEPNRQGDDDSKNAADGRVVLRALAESLLDNEPPGFLGSESSQYVHHTSAGPFWTQSAIPYFLCSDDRPLWVIRTWWGQRVVVDLQRAEFLNSSCLDQELFRTAELKWIESTLADGLKHLEQLPMTDLSDEEHENNWKLLQPIESAAYQAGWLQADSVVLLLRRLEEFWPAHQSSSYGPIQWALLNELPLRQIAKLSLLRLEQQPRWLPHYAFDPKYIEDGKSGELFDVPDRPNRLKSDLLEPGLTQVETLLRIGAPDFIRRDYWEYDVFSNGDRHTIQIDWKDDPTPGSTIEQTAPTDRQTQARIAEIHVLEPQWKQITMRDHLLV